MRTLFLHIGAGKTGTTAIQRSVAVNKHILATNGVYAPMLDETCSIDSEDYMGNGALLIRPMVDMLETDILLQRFIQEIDIHAGDCKKILVSCEMLEWSNAVALEKLRHLCARESINVRIVYFVRDIFPYASSFWLQQVKNHGYREDWASFASGFVTPFRQTISRFQEVFGRDNIICKKYSPEPKGKVIGDFFSIFEVNQSDLIAVSNSINQSLTSATVEIALHINRMSALSDKPKRELIKLINHYLLKHGNTSRPRTALPEEVGKSFRERNYSNIPYVNSFLENESISWG